MSPRELRAGGRPGWSLQLAGSRHGIVAALVIFFAGFDVLEARLPAPVSRAAAGVFSSVQFLGTFFAVAWNMGEFVPTASPASRT